MWYEVDIRSRKNGGSIETIFSSQSYNEAYDVLNNWYKDRPELDIEENLEDYVDGSDGVFADIYEVEEPHGVGLWGCVVIGF